MYRSSSDIGVIDFANFRVVNFLDVKFDIIKGTYQPYRKPDNTPVYINKDSNHPPSISKQLPQAIAKRISDISSNEEIFKNAIPTYNEALTRVVSMNNYYFKSLRQQTVILT